jgi:hypothetical protein
MGGRLDHINMLGGRLDILELRSRSAQVVVSNQGET